MQMQKEIHPVNIRIVTKKEAPIIRMLLNHCEECHFIIKHKNPNYGDYCITVKGILDSDNYFEIDGKLFPRKEVFVDGVEQYSLKSGHPWFETPWRDREYENSWRWLLSLNTPGEWEYPECNDIYLIHPANLVFPTVLDEISNEYKEKVLKYMAPKLSEKAKITSAGDIVLKTPFIPKKMSRSQRKAYKCKEELTRFNIAETERLKECKAKQKPRRDCTKTQTWTDSHLGHKKPIGTITEINVIESLRQKHSRGSFAEVRKLLRLERELQKPNRNILKIKSLPKHINTPVSTHKLKQTNARITRIEKYELKAKTQKLQSKKYINLGFDKPQPLSHVCIKNKTGVITRVLKTDAIQLMEQTPDTYTYCTKGEWRIYQDSLRGIAKPMTEANANKIANRNKKGHRMLKTQVIKVPVPASIDRIKMKNPVQLWKTILKPIISWATGETKLEERVVKEGKIRQEDEIISVEKKKRVRYKSIKQVQLSNTMNRIISMVKQPTKWEYVATMKNEKGTESTMKGAIQLNTIIATQAVDSIKTQLVEKYPTYTDVDVKISNSTKIDTTKKKKDIDYKTAKFCFYKEELTDKPDKVLYKKLAPGKMHNHYHDSLKKKPIGKGYTFITSTWLSDTKIDNATKKIRSQVKPTFSKVELISVDKIKVNMFKPKYNRSSKTSARIKTWKHPITKSPLTNRDLRKGVY